MAEEGKRAGPLVTFLAAWGVNLAFDGVGWLVPGLTPPHLLLRYAPDFVAQMVSPGVMAPMASVVLAAIDMLMLGVVPPGARRRALHLSLWMLAFFVFAEGLLAITWLDAPAGAVAGGLAFGAVRSGAAGWLLARLQGGGTAPEGA